MPFNRELFPQKAAGKLNPTRSIKCSMEKTAAFAAGRLHLFKPLIFKSSTVAGIITLTSGWLICPTAIAQIVDASELNPATPVSQSSEAILLFVNPATGNDATGNGSDRAPLKTITQALQLAHPNTVILLAPGTYSAETGEQFPLKLKPRLTLQGQPETRGQNVVIRGGGEFLSPTFARQNITLLAANQSALVGVTITNPNPRGYGLWIESTSPLVVNNTFTASTHDGVSVTGNSGPKIQGNYFYQNGANGMTIYGTSRPELRDNIFENTGFGINIAQKAAPLLVGNRVTQNKDGIVSQASAQPILRNNVIDRNSRDGVVAIAQARPDLGTTTEPGGNVFSGNGRFDINNDGDLQIIPAYGNQLVGDRTKGRLDLQGAVGQLTPSNNAVPTVPTVPTAAVPLPSDSTLPPVAIRQKPLPALRISENPMSSAPLSTAKAKLPPPPNLAVNRASRELENRTPPPSMPLSERTTAQSTQPRLEKNIIFGQALQIDALKPLNNRVELPVPDTAPVADAQPNSSLPRLAQVTAQRNAPTVDPATHAISAASFPVPASLSESRATVANSNSTAIAIAVPPPQIPAALPVSLQQSSNRSLPAAIPLDVPPPQSPDTAARPLPPLSQSVLNRPLPAARIPLPAISLRSAPPVGDAIPIAVPPPETTVIPRPVAPRLQPPSNPSIAPVATVGLLPVPSANIPVGRGGKAIAVNPDKFRSTEEPPLPPPQVVALKLRYRVIVLAESEQDAAAVKSLIPDAFEVSSQGRMVLQAGAFGDRTKADQLLEALTGQGLQAAIEQL